MATSAGARCAMLVAMVMLPCGLAMRDSFYADISNLVASNDQDDNNLQEQAGETHRSLLTARQADRLDKSVQRKPDKRTTEGAQAETPGWNPEQAIHLSFVNKTRVREVEAPRLSMEYNYNIATAIDFIKKDKTNTFAQGVALVEEGQGYAVLYRDLGCLKVAIDLAARIPVRQEDMKAAESPWRDEKKIRVPTWDVEFIKKHLTVLDPYEYTSSLATAEHKLNGKEIGDPSEGVYAVYSKAEAARAESKGQGWFVLYRDQLALKAAADKVAKVLEKKAQEIVQLTLTEDQIVWTRTSEGTWEPAKVYALPDDVIHHGREDHEEVPAGSVYLEYTADAAGNRGGHRKMVVSTNANIALQDPKKVAAIKKKTEEFDRFMGTRDGDHKERKHHRRNSWSGESWTGGRGPSAPVDGGAKKTRRRAGSFSGKISKEKARRDESMMAWKGEAFKKKERAGPENPDPETESPSSPISLGGKEEHTNKRFRISSSMGDEERLEELPPKRKVSFHEAKAELDTAMAAGDGDQLDAAIKQAKEADVQEEDLKGAKDLLASLRKAVLDKVMRAVEAAEPGRNGREYSAMPDEANIERLWSAIQKAKEAGVEGLREAEEKLAWLSKEKDKFTFPQTTGKSSRPKSTRQRMGAWTHSDALEFHHGVLGDLQLWREDQKIILRNVDDRALDKADVPLLDKHPGNYGEAVSEAVDRLTRDPEVSQKFPDGVCVVFSKRQDSWFVLYRDFSCLKRAAEVAARVPMKATASTQQWSDQQKILLPMSKEDDRARTVGIPSLDGLLDYKESISEAVQLLKKDPTKVPGGVCALWSKRTASSREGKGWLFLYRDAKSLAAVAEPFGHLFPKRQVEDVVRVVRVRVRNKQKIWAKNSAGTWIPAVVTFRGGDHLYWHGQDRGEVPEGNIFVKYAVDKVNYLEPKGKLVANTADSISTKDPEPEAGLVEWEYVCDVLQMRNTCGGWRQDKGPIGTTRSRNATACQQFCQQFANQEPGCCEFQKGDKGAKGKCFVYESEAYATDSSDMNNWAAYCWWHAERKAQQVQKKKRTRSKSTSSLLQAEPSSLPRYTEETGGEHQEAVLQKQADSRRGFDTDAWQVALDHRANQRVRH